MATIRKRGDKWYAIYVDASGKQRMKAAYSDAAESRRYALRMEDESRRIRLGDVDPQEDARRVERAKPVDIHLSDYKASLQAAGRSNGHVTYTCADIEKFLAFSAVKSASEITKPQMDRFVLHLKTTERPHAQTKGMKIDSNKTINRRVSSVQQFLRHLHNVGGVKQYVLNRYPKLPTGGKYKRRTSRALTREERDTLLSDMEKMDRQPLHVFAALTGIRTKEIRHTTPSMVDLKHKQIHLPAHVTKSKNAESVHIHPALMPILKNRCETIAPDAPLFFMPTQKCLNRNLRADCERLKIDPKHVSFHSFRHTFCTLLAQANVHPALLQKLARHADLETTLSYYVHLQRSDELAAMALL